MQRGSISFREQIQNDSSSSESCLIIATDESLYTNSEYDSKKNSNKELNQQVKQKLQNTEMSEKQAELNIYAFLNEILQVLRSGNIILMKHWNIFQDKITTSFQECEKIANAKINMQQSFTKSEVEGYIYPECCARILNVLIRSLSEEALQLVEISGNFQLSSILLASCQRWLEIFYNKNISTKMNSLKSLILNSLGTVARKKGEFSKAFQLFESALRIEQQRESNFRIKGLENIKQIKRNLNSLNYSENQPKSDEQAGGEGEFLGLCYLNMSILYSSLGNHKLSLENANNAVIEQQRLFFGFKLPDEENEVPKNNQLSQEINQFQQIQFKKQVNTLSVCYFNLASEMEYFLLWDDALRNYEHSYLCSQRYLGNQNKSTSQFYEEFKLFQRRMKSFKNSQDQNNNNAQNFNFLKMRKKSINPKKKRFILEGQLSRITPSRVSNSCHISPNQSQNMSNNNSIDGSSQSQYFNFKNISSQIIPSKNKLKNDSSQILANNNSSPHQRILSSRPISNSCKLSKQKLFSSPQNFRTRISSPQSNRLQLSNKSNLIQNVESEIIEDDNEQDPSHNMLQPLEYHDNLSRLLVSSGKFYPMTIEKCDNLVNKSIQNSSNQQLNMKVNGQNQNDMIFINQQQNNHEIKKSQSKKGKISNQINKFLVSNKLQQQATASFTSRPIISNNLFAIKSPNKFKSILLNSEKLQQIEEQKYVLQNSISNQKISQEQNPPFREIRNKEKQTRISSRLIKRQDLQSSATFTKNLLTNSYSTSSLDKKNMKLIELSDSQLRAQNKKQPIQLNIQKMIKLQESLSISQKAVENHILQKHEKNNHFKMERKQVRLSRVPQFQISDDDFKDERIMIIQNKEELKSSNSSNSSLQEQDYFGLANQISNKEKPAEQNQDSNHNVEKIEQIFERKSVSIYKIEKEEQSTPHQTIGTYKLWLIEENHIVISFSFDQNRTLFHTLEAQFLSNQHKLSQPSLSQLFTLIADKLLKMLVINEYKDCLSLNTNQTSKLRFLIFQGIHIRLIQISEKYSCLQSSIHSDLPSEILSSLTPAIQKESFSSIKRKQINNSAQEYQNPSDDKSSTTFSSNQGKYIPFQAEDVNQEKINKFKIRAESNKERSNQQSQIPQIESGTNLVNQQNMSNSIKKREVEIEYLSQQNKNEVLNKNGNCFERIDELEELTPVLSSSSKKQYSNSQAMHTKEDQSDLFSSSSSISPILALRQSIPKKQKNNPKEANIKIEDESNYINQRKKSIEVENQKNSLEIKGVISKEIDYKLAHLKEGKDAFKNFEDSNIQKKSTSPFSNSKYAQGNPWQVNSDYLSNSDKRIPCILEKSGESSSMQAISVKIQGDKGNQQNSYGGYLQNQNSNVGQIDGDSLHHLNQVGEKPNPTNPQGNGMFSNYIANQMNPSSSTSIIQSPVIPVGIGIPQNLIIKQLQDCSPINSQRSIYEHDPNFTAFMKDFSPLLDLNKPGSNPFSGSQNTIQGQAQQMNAIIDYNKQILRTQSGLMEQSMSLQRITSPSPASKRIRNSGQMIQYSPQLLPISALSDSNFVQNVGKLNHQYQQQQQQPFIGQPQFIAPIDFLTHSSNRNSLSQQLYDQSSIQHSLKLHEHFNSPKNEREKEKLKDSFHKMYNIYESNPNISGSPLLTQGYPKVDVSLRIDNKQDNDLNLQKNEGSERMIQNGGNTIYTYPASSSIIVNQQSNKNISYAHNNYTRKSFENKNNVSIVMVNKSLTNNLGENEPKSSPSNTQIILPPNYNFSRQDTMNNGNRHYSQFFFQQQFFQNNQDNSSQNGYQPQSEKSESSNSDKKEENEQDQISQGTKSEKSLNRVQLSSYLKAQQKKQQESLCIKQIDSKFENEDEINQSIGGDNNILISHILSNNDIKEKKQEDSLKLIGYQIKDSKELSYLNQDGDKLDKDFNGKEDEKDNSKIQPEIYKKLYSQRESDFDFPEDSTLQKRQLSQTINSIDQTQRSKIFFLFLLIMFFFVDLENEQRNSETSQNILKNIILITSNTVENAISNIAMEDEKGENNQEISQFDMSPNTKSTNSQITPNKQNYMPFEGYSIPPSQQQNQTINQEESNTHSEEQQQQDLVEQQSDQLKLQTYRRKSNRKISNGQQMNQKKKQSLPLIIISPVPSEQELDQLEEQEDFNESSEYSEDQKRATFNSQEYNIDEESQEESECSITNKKEDNVESINDGEKEQVTKEQSLEDKSPGLRNQNTKILKKNSYDNSNEVQGLKENENHTKKRESLLIGFVRNKVQSLGICNEDRSLTPKIKQKRDSMLIGAIDSFQNQIQIIEQKLEEEKEQEEQKKKFASQQSQFSFKQRSNTTKSSGEICFQSNSNLKKEESEGDEKDGQNEKISIKKYQSEVIINSTIKDLSTQQIQLSQPGKEQDSPYFNVSKEQPAQLFSALCESFNNEENKGENQKQIDKKSRNQELKENPPRLSIKNNERKSIFKQYQQQQQDKKDSTEAKQNEEFLMNSDDSSYNSSARSITKTEKSSQTQLNSDSPQKRPSLLNSSKLKKIPSFEQRSKVFTFNEKPNDNNCIIIKNLSIFSQSNQEQKQNETQVKEVPLPLPDLNAIKELSKINYIDLSSANNDFESTNFINKKINNNFPTTPLSSIKSSENNSSHSSDRLQLRQNFNFQGASAYDSERNTPSNKPIIQDQQTNKNSLNNSIKDMKLSDGLKISEYQFQERQQNE